jgi:hypothetical protein
VLVAQGNEVLFEEGRAFLKHSAILRVDNFGIADNRHVLARIGAGLTGQAAFYLQVDVEDGQGELPPECVPIGAVLHRCGWQRIIDGLHLAEGRHAERQRISGRCVGFCGTLSVIAGKDRRPGVSQGWPGQVPLSRCRKGGGRKCGDSQKDRRNGAALLHDFRPHYWQPDISGSALQDNLGVWAVGRAFLIRPG